MAVQENLSKCYSSKIIVKFALIKIEKMSEEKKNEILEFEIPIGGSLGMLALGAVGYLAWKKKVEEAKVKGNSLTENTIKDGKATS